jgi:hypothetical protein
MLRDVSLGLGRLLLVATAALSLRGRRPAFVGALVFLLVHRLLALPSFFPAPITAVLVAAVTAQVQVESALADGTENLEHPHRGVFRAGNHHRMAKRSKRKGRGKREDRLARIDRQTNDDVAQDHAAVLTCSSKAAAEFIVIGEHYLKDLELDIPYLQVALEIWAEHPELAKPLRGSLEELLQALITHCQALKEINKKFERLAADPGPHIHLDPVERYRRLISERLFSASPAA